MVSLSFTAPLGTAMLRTIFLLQFKFPESEVFSHFSSFDLERIWTATTSCGVRNPMKHRRKRRVLCPNFGVWVLIFFCDFCDWKLALESEWVGTRAMAKKSSCWRRGVDVSFWKTAANGFLIQMTVGSSNDVVSVDEVTCVYNAPPRGAGTHGKTWWEIECWLWNVC